MNEVELPTYDVEEVTLEEAILMLATEEEKFEKRLDWTKKSIKHVEEIIGRFQGSL